MKSCRVLLLLATFAGALRSQQVPPASLQYGAFAFPDPGGTRLLMTSGLSQPAQLHTAVCNGGRRFAITFERRQDEREGNDGRQTPSNFDKLAGSLFSVKDGKVDAGATCFLAADDLLSAGSLLPAIRPAEPGPCDPDIRGRLAVVRARPVVNCWQIAALPAGKSVILAEFARKENDALASIVLIDADRMIFDDYTGRSRGESADLWRVDDGGILDPGAFEIVLVLQRGTSYVFGLNWSGAEGDALALLESTTDRFAKVIEDYWYRAPL